MILLALVLSALSLPAMAEDATVEDLVEVQSAWLKTLNTPRQDRGFCAMSQADETVIKSYGRKYLCALRDSDLGSVEKQGVRVQIENDNFAMKSVVGDRLKSGDDKGRTFSADLRYERVYEDGRRYLQLRSDGFGKSASVNGTIRAPNGDRYIEFTEIDRLLLGKEARVDGKVSAVMEGEAQFASDRGYIAQKIQDFWHHHTDTKVAYQYLDHSKSEVLAAFRAGVKVMQEAALGSIQCQAVVEAVPGANTRGQLDGRLRAEINANTGSWAGRAVDNPWLAVSAWKELSRDTWGTWEQEGVRASTSIRAWKTTVTPYMGVAKYRSEIDTQTSKAENRDEPIYLVGMLVEY